MAAVRAVGEHASRGFIFRKGYPVSIRFTADSGTFPGLVSGTYINVEVASPWKSDAYDFPSDLRYSVLYLLPEGRFAWFNYWPGFHYGRCAGQFTRNGATLELVGQDSVRCDTPDRDYSHKSFQRQVTLHTKDRKRVLSGLSDKEHQFIGWGIYIPFFDLGKHLFPQSWEELKGWIDSFLGDKT